MIPQRFIDAYLRFLLNYRRSVSIIIAAITLFFAYSLKDLTLHTDFFDFYPRQHPYIKIYNEFRRMFGSANVLQIIIKKKNGDIYNPETLQKVDRVTKFIIETKGVVPYQILSIASPKMKSINTFRGAVQIREVYYPGVPRTQEDADRVKFAVYATKGIHGVYVAEDDSAALVTAGFWEEALDFNYLYHRLEQLKAQENDENHEIMITGFPYLFTSIMRYAPQVLWVFGLTFFTIGVLLWVYFRTWTGIWVPLFSAFLSTIWGVAFGHLMGFNLDPLVMVIPIFLTARAISHSVQSMDRYHEEYHRLGDKHQAIVVSYGALFPPAIAAIVTDGLGILLVALAPIPLIQKVALFASFWIISIFISVVTLHPIILAYIDPPAAPGHDTDDRWSEKFYKAITDFTIWSSAGWRRYAVLVMTLVLFVGSFLIGRTLKVGDMTPGAALLFPDHPYNQAYDVLNHDFLGANQLIAIADTKAPDNIKTREPLELMEEFGTEMEEVEGAALSVSVVNIVKQLARLYHEGEPKWGFIPDNPKNIAQLFYTFTQSGQAGDLDRFIDPSYQFGTVVTLFRGHSNAIITNAIERAREFAKQHQTDAIEFRLAGGMFGILAAVNEKVEESYWTTLGIVFSVVALCLYLTYGSLAATILLMIPVVGAQFVCEAVMVLWKIDLNVNSLPVAAAGAGCGVDYGIYHFSRMLDTFDEGRDVDDAVDYATATTGRAIIFTASTMFASTIFWWFSSLKFQAEMGLLLSLLMAFNTVGGLIVVPALVKVWRPKFLLDRRDAARARLAREGAQTPQTHAAS
ncbi:MAG TPA: MMPL family transporter [Candidatus Binatia bacterium]